jgi:hypothetical protein
MTTAPIRETPQENILRRRLVSVDPPSTLFGYRPATVNWGAIGAVTPEYAEAFARAVLAAAKTARKLNAPVPTPKVRAPRRPPLRPASNLHR